MTRTRHFWGAAALAAGLALAQPAGAALITYAEPPQLSGDALNPDLLGTLGVGVNTVTGGPSVGASGDFNDAFKVLLAGTDRITRIAIDISNFTGGIGRAVASGSLAGPIGNFNVTYGADGSPVQFTGAVPGPGDLVITLSALQAYMSYNYVVNITVEAIPTTPVPEPATLALFGAGLLSLVATRRRAAPPRG